MAIAERVRDGERRGNRICARWGDHGDSPAPTSTPLLLPRSANADPAPGRMTPTGYVDPLHQTLTLTPPAALAPGDQVSPADRLFYPVAAIAAVFVLRVGQQFDSKVDAYLFYKNYVKLVGFSLRAARTSKEPTIVFATEKGGMIPKERRSQQRQKKVEKMRLPGLCEGQKDVRQNFWYYDHVQEAHNHNLEPYARMTRYMHTRKHMEEGINDIFSIMTKNGVPHQTELNVMSDLYDGQHMWGFTKKDINNRKAARAKEEREDDLNKHLQFFRECKENNEYFYWDVDADPKTSVIKNIFWSHASQRAEYKDFGDVITFDTTHKTNSKRMPLAMFAGTNNNLKNVTFG